MLKIENIGPASCPDIRRRLRELDDVGLGASQLVQQSAIHALSTLLKMGCNEQSAVNMLTSLRENMKLFRQEAARRGKPDLFPVDQTGFD